MIKKAVSCTLLVCLTIICLMVQPFSVFADNEPISGFDYTNYDELDYIKPVSSGAYIDTGISITQNITINIKFNYGDSDNKMFGSANGYFWGLEGTTYRTPSKLKQNLSFTAGSDYVVSATQSSLSINGNVQSLNNDSNSGYGNLMIFRYHASNSSNTLKVYYFEVYSSDNTLLAKFIPAKRKSDDVVGMYNIVNSTFYANSGSSSFEYGSVISYQPVVQQYTISTAVSPSGSGTVSGGGTYDSQSVISLVATANSGYQFSSWSDGNTSNPRSVTVTQDATYTAVFEVVTVPPTQYTITTGVSPAGSGSVSGGGTYDEGTVVSLSATANNGYVFANWSDNSTQNPRSITVSQNATYTAIFTEESVTPDPPSPPSGWTDWTDENDSNSYKDVTQSIDLSKIRWSIYLSRVIDYIELFGEQYQVNSGLNGSNLNSIGFTGSYYDNTITALTGCNSTSYNYSTSSSNQVDVLTIEPAIYGSFDSPTIGEDGTVFNFGISVNGGTSSNVTTSTNGFSNTTEACRLIGMGTGDGSVDGTTLLALGYQKKTITYNDGSLNGHTATVYVPGEEQFGFSADLSFLDDLMEQLYINVVSSLHVWGHDEFTINMKGDYNYYMPDTGYINSKAFIGSMLDRVQFQSSSPIQYTDQVFSIVPQQNTFATLNYNGVFDYHISNNEYDSNKTRLYWKGTSEPKWVFRTNTVDMSLYNDIFGNNNIIWDTYGRSFTIGSSHTITQSDKNHDSNLTVGTLLYTGIDNIYFYELVNNSILNRFNQLGSMMYGWFNRIYQAIGNITGGNESNEIINNVIEDNDINVDIEFNGLLQNVENYKDDIDLTLPEFNIPSDDVSGIQSLAGSFKQIYQDVYIDNGLGLLIFIPLLLLVLRLIL